MPYLVAPSLIVLAEGCEILLQSSQALLATGGVTADLPLAIAETLERVQGKIITSEITILEREQHLLSTLLQLQTPETLLGFLHHLVRGDLEFYLANQGQEEIQVEFPADILSLEVLAQLQGRLNLDLDEEEIFRSNIEALEQTLAEKVATRGISSTAVQDLREVLRDQLMELPPKQLWQLAQNFLSDETEEKLPDPTPDPPPTVAGPLLFMEIVDYLLNQEDVLLEAEERLDLQLNLSKAEAKFQAMDRIGKVDNIEDQQKLIRNWIPQHSVAELREFLSEWFTVEDKI